jgi:hypothetical protein
MRGQTPRDHAATPGPPDGSADRASVTLSDEAAVVRCYTKKTLAQFLGLSIRSLDRANALGLLPCPDLVVGRSPRVTRHNYTMAADPPASARQERGPAMNKKEYIKARIPAACQAAGEGKLHFEQRQVFYAFRPLFMEQFGEQPSSAYFCQVVTEYEAEHGEIPGLVRDARGYVYNPHTGEEIPLGTLDIANYQRPSWTFNKLVYIEKQGFVSALRQVDWPERNDCALMTSKGFTVRAARDLVDGLADTDEPCQVFCVHDADGPGTVIYQSFQEETKSRGARKVQIVNLGLEPAEGRAMGLQIESFEPNPKRRVPVADYVPDSDREWLQSNRIELNAMSSPRFVAWLDSKMSAYEGKLIPPNHVLENRFQYAVRDSLEAKITEEILRRADIYGLVETAIEEKGDAYREAIESLRREVKKALKWAPADLWRAPVERIATRIADSYKLPPMGGNRREGGEA